MNVKAVDGHRCSAVKRHQGHTRFASHKHVSNGRILVLWHKNAYTPERIARLKKLRASAHADWLSRYQHARKSRGWYHHLHLEVFEDEEGCWVGRIWDTVTEKLLHSADNSPDQEKSKTNLVAIARGYLVAEYPARSFPSADIEWLEPAGLDSDPPYFSLREV
jgi:hypothetical protein